MVRIRRLLVIAILAAAPGLKASAQALTEPRAFLYYAVWDTTTDDFIRTTVQRIEMSNADYQDRKEKFIDEFVTAAQSTAPAGAALTGAPGGPPRGALPGARPGSQRPGLAGQQAAAAVPMAEIRLPLDPNQSITQAPVVLAFDAQPVRQSIQSGSDPRALGEWTFAYWQLTLWEWYVTHETLMLSEDLTIQDVDDFVQTIQKKREPIWTWTEIRPETAEPKEWIQVNREFPPLEKPTEEESSSINVVRTMGTENFGGKMVAPQLPPSAGGYDLEAAALYRVYKDCAYAVDAQDHDRYFGLLNRLRERQVARDRYNEWVEDRHGLVIKFAEEWGRKFDGSEFDIDGVLYLVSEIGEPEPNVPLNGRNLVIDRIVTPYDLLNRDGTLKKPLPVED